MLYLPTPRLSDGAEYRKPLAAQASAAMARLQAAITIPPLLRSRPLNAPERPVPLLYSSPLSELAWDNAFGRLPGHFHARLAPTPLPEPYFVAAAPSAAATIGLDVETLRRPEAIEPLAGSAVLHGTDPLAAVYSGHQFGVYVPQLGDGRALLLGGVRGADGNLWELQLKGSGKTPYSRMGDGRAVLRSSIREFLCSEAMHALGIPTTRALAIMGSDLPVFRETVESAAVVTRIAPSFVRFGSFEYFFWRGEPEALRQLVDYVIDAFYPQCRDAGDGPAPYLSLLEEVARRTARLIAQWQGVGFCHGVMNSDNMSILGLTIDYGPFGFIDGFDAGHICNHSDEHGRYAYKQQPAVAYWNLYCLGQALIPLTGDITATQAALDVYKDEYAQAIDLVMRAKLGLATVEAGDDALIERIIEVLHANRADWTLFWRKLAKLGGEAAAGDEAVRDLFIDRSAFDAWTVDYRARLRREGSDDGERAGRMNRVNPKYVLRNHLAEVAIRKARGDDGEPRDFSEVERLLHVLAHPYDDRPEFDGYATAPPEWAGSLSLSCSS
jgi:serine/tyrosine/threonine adenylyltransferase